MGSPNVNYGPRLLEGEDPNTTHPGDAQNWIAIYGQLISFNEALLLRVEEGMVPLVPVAKADALSDFVAVEDQLNRYRDQLQFWYGRLWDLQGVGLDSDGRIVSHHGRAATLTVREFQLLEVLVRHPGSSLKPKALLLQAWHNPGLYEEELRTYIGRLRKKLDSIDLADIISTPRRGYSLVFRTALR